MGYTHNWIPKKVSAKKFLEFSNVCGKLYRSLPEKSNTAGGFYADEKIEIGDEAGHLGVGNRPEFSKDIVIFNGVGDMAHETFYVGLKQLNSEFCKTARKPYDLLVCACLIASINMLGYKVGTDGITIEGNIDDWKPALEFYNKTVKDANMSFDTLQKHLIKNSK